MISLTTRIFPSALSRAYIHANELQKKIDSDALASVLSKEISIMWNLRRTKLMLANHWSYYCAYLIWIKMYLLTDAFKTKWISHSSISVVNQHISHLSSVCYTFAPLCPSFPSYTSTFLFFHFLASVERWSLGSHTSVSAPTSLQNPPTVVVALQISAGRLCGEWKRQKGRNRLLPPNPPHHSPTVV